MSLVPKGNDIVTLVFQEEDSAPLDVSTFSSKYQHVFIIVRVFNAGTDEMYYKVATVRRGDVREFRPDLPDDAIFSLRETMAAESTLSEFKQFLLRKGEGL